MIQKLKNLFSLRERFSRGAAILTITTFFSYVTGMLRDRFFAQKFGAGEILDIYNAAFTVPDLLLNILVMSALAGGFVPIFSGLLAQDKQEEANRVANTMLHAALITMIVAGTIAAIFMPQFAKIIAPGFSPENRDTLVSLSRLMLLSPIIMAISNTLGYVFISYKRFLAYGLSPILYNLGIIGGAVLLYPIMGMYGLVTGTLIGALIHLLPRVIDLVRTPFKYSPALTVQDKNFQTLVRLAVPKMFGHPVEQITFAGFNSIATTIIKGGLSSISFARNFQSAGVSLFGISFSVAIFPLLSEAAALKDRDKFIKHFVKAFKDILIFTVPCMIGLYLLSDLPIRIFLSGGKFTQEDAIRTSQALSIFALSIPTESLVHLFARSFYALKNTYIPVLLSIFALIISVSFAYLKAPLLGIIAIPYGFFLGSFIEIVLLGLLLSRRVKSLR